MKRLLLFFTLVLLLGSFCQKTPIKIQSQQLMAEYLRNNDESDAKYKGKQLLVTGIIVSRKPDSGMVMLKGTPSAVSNVVVCHFQDSQTRDAIRQASDNQEIQVQGENTGYDFEGVHLRPCKLSRD
jgi:hypothetical protein